MLLKISTMPEAALKSKLASVNAGIEKFSGMSEDSTLLSVYRQQRGELIAELARRDSTALQMAA